MPKFHDDIPISSSEQDEFEYGAIAKAIAKCTLGIKVPNGSVIAINGPWGSGKSSLVNLVCERIEHQTKECLENRPVIIHFNSWCYRTEEGVVAGFFQEIQSGLSISSRKLKVDTGAISAYLFALSLYASTNNAVDPEIGSIMMENIGNGWMERISKYMKVQRIKRKNSRKNNIKRLQEEIGKELASINRKILVVIDDIDRLSPEEAIAVFRLIKSVGRINNVIYLVAYDRMIIEKLIKKKYKSEKGHYLEKVVQASFDLPEPNESVVKVIFYKRLKKIFKDEKIFSEENVLENRIRGEARRTNDLIHKIVVPEIRTLRDVHRFCNIISVTYKSVKNCVSVADFIVLECFRVFHPNLYHMIRSNKLILTRITDSPEYKDKNVLDHDSRFLSGELKSNRLDLKKSLEMIFPSLNPKSLKEIPDLLPQWNQDKRVCSALHFDTYFQFSISDDAISNEEFSEFVGNASNKDFVEETISNYKKQKSAYGRTKLSFLLEKIERTNNAISVDDAKPFLVTLYSVSEELGIASDTTMNIDRHIEGLIKRLTESILNDRFTIEETSNIMLEVCKAAPLRLRMDLCALMCRHYKLGQFSGKERWVFLTEGGTQNLRNTTLAEIRNSIASNPITSYGDLPIFIIDWARISDDSDEIKSYFRNAIESNIGHLIFASRKFVRLFPQESFNSKSEKSRLITLDKLIDVRHFARVWTH